MSNIKHKYTEEQFIEAIRSSLSIAEALRKLKIAPHGGNYATARQKIKALGLDTTHMTGMLWGKGRKLPAKRPIDVYLRNKANIKSDKLRQRLLREGIFEKKCSSCNLSEWLSKPIPLELDHIDGNHFNNALENLRILCPNCHSLTPTHRRRKDYLARTAMGLEGFAPPPPKGETFKVSAAALTP